MTGTLPGLAFLTFSHAHHHGGGMVDWIAHLAISSVIHAVVYGLRIPTIAAIDSD